MGDRRSPQGNKQMQRFIENKDGSGIKRGNQGSRRGFIQRSLMGSVRWVKYRVEHLESHELFNPERERLVQAELGCRKYEDA